MPLAATLDRHPHAKAVLEAALPPAGNPSHAYLFHGPAGSGKATVARAFAAELLAEGSPDPERTRARVMRGAHPDLTWVVPTGAAIMRVEDIEEPVVGAASRTPFEATRRVFVLEGVDTMNDQAANRMLKTLEEPPSFAHLVLLTDRPGDVLPTIASRCQPVRFDAPAPEELEATLSSRVAPDVARACSRLALGDGDRAVALALGEGPALRAAAEAYARGCLTGALDAGLWTALVQRAKALGDVAQQAVEEQTKADAEVLPQRERKRAEREGADAAKRAGRRARTGALDEALRLTGLWLRDVAAVADGAEDVVLATDRLDALRADAQGRDAHRLREGVELVDETRAALTVNVTEDLALEALAYRLMALLAPPP
ncbi:MAG TPA: AAA family ATPase [Solirubrobacteraceae bacterium]|nr:AAA family ATPase [Solirubrobacteraceae bacterium]